MQSNTQEVSHSWFFIKTISKQKNEFPVITNHLLFQPQNVVLQQKNGEGTSRVVQSCVSQYYKNVREGQKKGR